MLNIFNAADWYWIVGGDESRLWSSRAKAYRSPNNADFKAWKDEGRAPSRILNEEELHEVLEVNGVTASQRYSFLEFMELFTSDEQLAIAGAAMTNVAAKLWYDRAVGAQFIDLADDRLGAGLQALVDAALITGERRDTVLAGLPPAG